jgi:hypothetical protein
MIGIILTLVVTHAVAFVAGRTIGGWRMRDRLTGRKRDG